MAESDVFNRLAQYDKEKYPPDSPQKPKPRPKIGPTKSQSEIDAIVERLKKYDSYKYPPSSSLHRSSIQEQSDSEENKYTKEEVEEILSRLTKVDFTKGPPDSRLHRKSLGYGKHDYYMGPEPERGPKKSRAEVDEIVQRLRSDQKKGPRYKPEKPEKRKYTEEEINEIYQRLQKCDFTKYPPDSRSQRVELPYNRYSYVPESSLQGMYQAPKVPKEKLDEILQRLCTFDSNKYPPDSKPHLKK